MKLGISSVQKICKIFNADKTFDLMKEVSGGLKASIIIGKAKSKTGAGTHPHRPPNPQPNFPR
jgi:hypothetical protein